MSDLLWRNTISFGTALTWTLEKSSSQPEIKVHLEFRFNLRSVLLDFQSFTEKPVFECASAHPIMLFLSDLGKSSMDRVSVICKLDMKWYPMRIYASWLFSWLMRLSPDRAIQVWALAVDIVLCSLGRLFTLTVPLSTKVYHKWIPLNLCWG